MARLLGKTTAEIKLAELNLAPQRYILPHSTFPSQDSTSTPTPFRRRDEEVLNSNSSGQ